MWTVIQYLFIALVVGAVVFAVAMVVFGRAEQLAPLPVRNSPTHLPDGSISAAEIHGVRFGVALRGYRMSDVDWTLDRLAEEVDRLHERIAVLESGGVTAPGDVSP